MYLTLFVAIAHVHKCDYVNWCRSEARRHILAAIDSVRCLICTRFSDTVQRPDAT